MEPGYTGDVICSDCSQLAEQGSLDTVDDLSQLLPVIAQVNCSAKIKWICAQTWEEPLLYYEKYRALVDLTAHVLQSHAETLQPSIDEAVDRAELLAERVKIIASPRRLESLMVLRKEDLCGQELVERLQVTPGTVSHHMSTLVGAGFVVPYKNGPRISYSLNRERIQNFLDELKGALL